MARDCGLQADSLFAPVTTHIFPRIPSEEDISTLLQMPFASLAYRTKQGEATAYAPGLRKKESG